MGETLLNQGSYYRAAIVPEAAVFQRISDLSKTRWQPPRQEKLQYIYTKSHFKKPRFLTKMALWDKLFFKIRIRQCLKTLAKTPTTL